jgi:hypothetical protein
MLVLSSLHAGVQADPTTATAIYMAVRTLEAVVMRALLKQRCPARCW